MDGTITPPRQKFDMSLYEVFSDLAQKSQIGIVTGSDVDYLFEQLSDLLNTDIGKKIHLLPCNGTKYFSPSKKFGEKHQLVHSNNMREQLGEQNFKNIMMTLLAKQNSIQTHPSTLPLTGHFISYRGSMINWCPIGRNASDEDRKKFIKYDSNRTPSYRIILLDSLKERFALDGLSDLINIKLGGDTSFDIYPKKWNKTYALNHFPDWESWFVGDRCGLNGNDKEIYDLLQKDNRSFSTKDTNNTRLIIKEKILPHL